MHLITKEMEEFRRQLEKGSIRIAYKALLSYMMGLRAYFKNNLANSTISGLYQGFMDMTYFAIFPPSLKRHNLKIAIVFNYEVFRFEAWLAGRSRKVQRQYWELFKNSQWPEYRVATPAKGVDFILECDLASDFDLHDSEALTSNIEAATVEFITDIEGFLSGYQPLEQSGAGDEPMPCHRPAAQSGQTDSV